MILHHIEVGDGCPLVILHGLLGSSGNWRTIAKKLSDICRVIAIDLPNHGASPHMEKADINVICESVIETMQALDVEKAVLLGHSMGGKIAMQLSSDYPDALEALIVADMLPKSIPPAHLFILRACEQLDLASATHRSELDQALTYSVVQPEVRAFILKNIKRDVENRFYWQVNLRNIIANYRIVSDAPELLRPYTGATLFIGGENSPYKIATEENLIHGWFPNAQIAVIKNAGHLVHADQPEIFSATVRNFILSL